MILAFFGATVALVVLGALVALFLWMVVCSVGQACGERRSDRARPWMRDV